MACRSGDIDRAMSDLDLANHTKPNSWGAYPLHWLFMFPNDSADSATKILSSIDHGTGHGSLDAVANGFIEIDPQLPIRLTGTPLAFATMIGSVSTVCALLNLGADPLIGKGPAKFSYSAWMVACKYHLADVLDLFLDRIGLPAWDADAAKNWLSKEERLHAEDLFDQSAKAFSETTRSERAFFPWAAHNRSSKSYGFDTDQTVCPISRG